MALLHKPALERLSDTLPTTEPVADGKLWMNGPFFAISGIDSTLVSTDQYGTVNLSPLTGAQGTPIHTFGVAMDWVDSANGRQIWPITVNPRSATAGSSNPMPRWGIQLTNSLFSGQSDFIEIIGLFGDGATTETNLKVRESTYNIGGGITSHETYDVVQHFGWESSRRVGWGWSSFSPRNGNGGTVQGFANFDSFHIGSTDPNTANPSVGAFGQYFSVTPTVTTGDVAMQLQNSPLHGGTYSVTIAGGTSGSPICAISVNRPFHTSVTTTGFSSVPILRSIDGTIVERLYAGASWKTYTIPTGSCEELVSSADNRTDSEIRTRHQNLTTGVWVETGVASATYNASHVIKRNRSYVMSYLGDGLVIGTNDANPVLIAPNGTEAIRWLSDGGMVVPSKTPSSATATGTAGEIAFDDNYIYRCVATNTWKRVAISTW